MTLENIKKFRDGIAKGRPFVITCDNEHIFYDNIEDGFPIIWDDDALVLIQLRPNSDYAYHSDKNTMCLDVVEYDTIQFMKILLTTAEAVEYLNSVKSKLGENADKKYQSYITIISKAATHRMPKGQYDNSVIKQPRL